MNSLNTSLHTQESPSQQEINTLCTVYGQGRYLEAEALAQTMTARFPRFGFGWTALGAVLKQMGRGVDALAAMRKAEALTPNDAEVHYNLGLTLNDLGRLDEAEACYRSSLLIKPDSAEAHYKLGNTLYALGRLDEAGASYRSALLIKPDYAEAHYNLGNTLNDLGRLNEAEACYRSALLIKPDYAEAHNDLGNTFNALGRLDEAEACYRSALQIKPDYAEAHNNLALTLMKLDRLDEAEACYRSALLIQPDFAEVHYNLGNTFMKLGRLDEAITQFERTMALAPKLNSAKFSLCQALYELNYIDGEKAKRLAYRAREIYPDDPIVLRGTSGIIGETQIATDETIYTRELFNGFAKTFESTLEKLDYSTPKHLANELGLESGEAGHALDVLDAGCGTGLCGTYLRPVARTLVGVDLSSEMLRLAKEKNLYDVLHEGGINDFLKQNVSAFDLIVFADVLVYFGDLRDLIESSFRSLRQNGVIAISAECMEHEASGDTYALQPSGRYRHSTGYIKRLFEDSGFSVEKSTLCTLRMENKKPVAGCIVIAKLIRPRPQWH